MFTSAQFCQICACCYIHPNAAGGTESAGLVQTTDGSIHQCWYDDPRSLALKYAAAAERGARGVAFWTGDSFHRANGTKSAGAAKDMWAVVPTPARP